MTDWSDFKLEIIRLKIFTWTFGKRKCMKKLPDGSQKVNGFKEHKGFGKKKKDHFSSLK